MTWLAGADGCKNGWVVVLRKTGSRDVEVRAVETLAEVLEWADRPSVIGIDVPIGLLDEAVPGGRDCDRAARALLGEPRARSVFSPPVRPALGAKTYKQAVRLNRASSPHKIGISQQAFGILPKIREVDDLLSPSPELHDAVVEVHPEVTFYELNRGRPLTVTKKTGEGRAARLELLDQAWQRQLSDIVEAHKGSGVSRDDIIDAMAVCWTAERVFAGESIRLPAEPPLDSKGLRMEIVR